MDLQGDRGMLLGIFLSGSIRAYDATRKTQRNLLARLNDLMAKKAFPKNETEVRGHVVAADNIVEAIISHGTMDRYEIFVHPWFKDRASELLKGQRLPASNVKKVSIHCSNDVMKRGYRHPLLHL